MAKTMQAPTTKVANGIENGLYAMVHNVTVCAREDHPIEFEDFDPKTGEKVRKWDKGGYSITSHDGEMPAFHTSTYATLQELANAMRECADLRTWRLIDHV